MKRSPLSYGTLSNAEMLVLGAAFLLTVVCLFANYMGLQS